MIWRPPGHLLFTYHCKNILSSDSAISLVFLSKSHQGHRGEKEQPGSQWLRRLHASTRGKPSVIPEGDSRHLPVENHPI